MTAGDGRLNDIIVAIIGGVVAIIVASIQVWRKKTNPDSSKDTISSVVANKELIEALNATVQSQTEQIRGLRGVVDEQRLQLEDKDLKIQNLVERVSKLEQLTIEQALMIKALEDRARTRRTNWHSNEGGEKTTA